MPDFTVHSARCCLSNVKWSHPIQGSSGLHVVTYGFTPHGRYQYGYSCTCDAFKFGGGKECKHIKALKPFRCGYGEEVVVGSPTDMGDICPKCGGPTVATSYIA